MFNVQMTREGDFRAVVTDADGRVLEARTLTLQELNSIREHLPKHGQDLTPQEFVAVLRGVQATRN